MSASREDSRPVSHAERLDRGQSYRFEAVFLCDGTDELDAKAELRRLLASAMGPNLGVRAALYSLKGRADIGDSLVTLHLSRRAAEALANLIRWIGGEPGGVRDAFNLRPGEREGDAEGDSISAQLMRQGIGRAPREAYFLRLGEIEARPEWPAEGGVA